MTNEALRQIFVNENIIKPIVYQDIKIVFILYKKMSLFIFMRQI